MILFSFVHSHSVSLNLSHSFMWSNEFRAKNKQSYNPAPMQCGWSVLFQKWKWRLEDSFSLTSFIHFSHVFICLFICIFGLVIILVEVALELLFWNLTGFFQSNKFLCMVFNYKRYDMRFIFPYAFKHITSFWRRILRIKMYSWITVY